jgi:hypothetical protein
MPRQLAQGVGTIVNGVDVPGLNCEYGVVARQRGRIGLEQKMGVPAMVVGRRVARIQMDGAAENFERLGRAPLAQVEHTRQNQGTGMAGVQAQSLAAGDPRVRESFAAERVECTSEGVR